MSVVYVKPCILYGKASLRIHHFKIFTVVYLLICSSRVLNINAVNADPYVNIITTKPFFLLYYMIEVSTFGEC